MSLVGGYPQHYHSGPPMSHDFYPYHNRFQDHHAVAAAAAATENPYIHSWMINTQTEVQMGPETYGFGGNPENGDYGSMGIFSYSETPPTRVRCVKRRYTANRKERRRTISINSAFASLRGCIPNVPSDTKLSKIKTLRLATSYIAYLMDVLNKDDPKLAEDGFKADLSKPKAEKAEEKQKRKESMEAELAATSEKKGKGRTGWPQHVWASELKPTSNNSD